MNAIKNDIVMWIKDYFKHNASPETKAVIGISGGKDSSVCAALCVAALGKSRVLGVLMPQGSQHDIDVSYELCEFLEIEHVEVNIGKSVNDVYSAIENTGLVLNDTAVFNTPARIRMTTLYAVSAIVGGRVVNTSNLSEDYVGWATKFGDMAGDFSPLSSLTYTQVISVGKALGLPEKFINKVPEDGLTGKTDEENFGFSYEVLDEYIRKGTCSSVEIKEKIDKLHKQSRHKFKEMPKY
ncbi:MAG: NAD(+) synthase [Oscillospiraceae bacterium]|nr:NAD(+) synthase [Oscillospiraceae bacterium]